MMQRILHPAADQTNVHHAVQADFQQAMKSFKNPKINQKILCQQSDRKELEHAHMWVTSSGVLENISIQSVTPTIPFSEGSDSQQQLKMITTHYGLCSRNEPAGVTPASNEANNDGMNLDVSDITHADPRVTEIEDDMSFHSVLPCGCSIKVSSQLQKQLDAKTKTVNI